MAASCFFCRSKRESSFSTSAMFLLKSMMCLTCIQLVKIRGATRFGKLQQLLFCKMFLFSHPLMDGLKLLQCLTVLRIKHSTRWNVLKRTIKRTEIRLYQLVSLLQLALLEQRQQLVASFHQYNQRGAVHSAL